MRRRNVIKNGIGLAASTSVFAGSAVASKGEGNQGKGTPGRKKKKNRRERLEIDDRTILSETSDKKVVAVALSKYEKVNKNSNNGKSKGKGQSKAPVEKTDELRSIVTVQKSNKISTADVSAPEDSETLSDNQNPDFNDGKIQKVDQDQYDKLKSGELEVSSVGGEVSTLSEHHLVASDTYGYELGDCNAYSSHDHVFSAVTAKFDKGLEDLGWTTVAAYLIASVESAGLIAAITAITGLGALAFDVDRSITVGFQEFDSNFYGWTQTMYSIEAGPQYYGTHIGTSGISAAPTHPSR